jgi:hypothetical protein
MLPPNLLNQMMRHMTYAIKNMKKKIENKYAIVTS